MIIVEKIDLHSQYQISQDIEYKIVFLHEYLLEWIDDLLEEYDISVELIQFLLYLLSLLFLEKELIR